jgi:hypothetical protein
MTIILLCDKQCCCYHKTKKYRKQLNHFIYFKNIRNFFKMARNSFLIKFIVAVLSLHGVASFVVPSTQKHPQSSSMKLASGATKLNDDDTPTMSSSSSLVKRVGQIATTAAVVISTSPLMALAEEVDDYEYGAVNAPIGIAWAGGLLAILTALLPVALQGGEKAFEEMKERDAGKWGTGESSSLNRRRKK